MIPVNFIRKAATGHPGGIQKGRPYYWWMYHGEKLCSKTHPKNSRLTYSVKQRRLFLAQETLEAALQTVKGFELEATSLLQGVVDGVVREIEEVVERYRQNEEHYLCKMVEEYEPPPDTSTDEEEDVGWQTKEKYERDLVCNARLSNLCRDKADAAKKVARQLTAVDFNSLPPVPHRKKPETWDDHVTFKKARKAYLKKARHMVELLQNVKWELDLRPRSEQEPENEVITDRVRYITRAKYDYPNGVKAGEPYCWWTSYGKKQYSKFPPPLQSPHHEILEMNSLQRTLNKIQSNEVSPRDLIYHFGSFARLVKKCRKSKEEVEAVFPDDPVVEVWQKKTLAARAILKALQSTGVTRLPLVPQRKRYTNQGWYTEEQEDTWNGHTTYKKATAAYKKEAAHVMAELAHIDFRGWFAAFSPSVSFL